MIAKASFRLVAWSIFALGIAAIASACTASDGGATRVKSCSDDHSCPVGQQCTANTECGGGRCDLGTNECVECTVSAHCSAGRDCVAGVCLSACNSDLECDAGKRCGLDKHCVECKEDADCAESKHCASGVCQDDTCTKGKVDCDPKTGGLRTCVANGTGLEVTACPASTSCVANSKGAECKPWQCSPGKASCAPSRAVVQVCADDGLSFDETECDDRESCVAGACVTRQCTPNHYFCQDNGSYLCSESGATSSFQKQCQAGTFCDADTGTCRVQPCKPAEKTCLDQGLIAATCTADGSGYERKACAASEVCESGNCVPLVCAPSQAFCAAGDVPAQCNVNGTIISKASPCAVGKFCKVNGAVASCGSSSCLPGALLCDGTRATVCQADGSGPVLGGTDCAQAGGLCSAGKCVAKLCQPNQRYCSGANIYLCSGDGSTSTFYSACGACNPATGTCVGSVCTPNSVTCSGTQQISKCDATGTSVTQQACATNHTCILGQCVPTVCTPNARSCKDGNAMQCNETGTALVVANICPSTTYCNSGYCQADACIPGAAVCNGSSALSTCAADGSGPKDAGTPCASGSICTNGACTPTKCTPNSTFCASGDVNLCNALGTASTLSAHCFSETYCSGAQCVPDVCPNGIAYCSGETVATCKPDGSGPASTGATCTDSGQVCGAGVCAASIVDTIGPGSGAFTFNYTDGQIIQVKKARKLTRVAIRGDIYGATIKSTFVYSSADGTNFYLLSSTAPEVPQQNPGWVDSGALNVQLQAGTTYLIGMNFVSPYVSYSDLATAVNPSFGTVLKAVMVDQSTLPSSFAPAQTERVLAMRLTTAAP
jgi:hypothetical protein